MDILYDFWWGVKGSWNFDFLVSFPGFLVFSLSLAMWHKLRHQILLRIIVSNIDEVSWIGVLVLSVKEISICLAEV